MRLPKRGEKGFTLIELLIVVAILGVLAAVVIPNVQRFIGAGETEAEETELSNIQAAVSAMMVDNEVGILEDGFAGDTVIVTLATNDMSIFPHATEPTVAEKGADLTFVGLAVTNGDIGAAADALPGCLLYGHTLVIDVNGDGIYDVGDDEIRIVNYVAQQFTTRDYKVDRYGTVTPGP